MQSGERSIAKVSKPNQDGSIAGVCRGIAKWLHSRSSAGPPTSRRQARVTVKGAAFATRNLVLRSRSMRRSTEGVTKAEASISMLSSSTSRADPRRSAPTM